MKKVTTSFIFSLAIIVYSSNSLARVIEFISGIDGGTTAISLPVVDPAILFDFLSIGTANNSLGSFDSQQRTKIGFPQAPDDCPAINGTPAGVQFPVTSVIVWKDANDSIVLTPDESNLNIFCNYPLPGGGGAGRFLLHFDVRGGSGKYECAVGSAVLDTTSVPLDIGPGSELGVQGFLQFFPKLKGQPEPLIGAIDTDAGCL